MTTITPFDLDALTGAIEAADAAAIAAAYAEDAVVEVLNRDHGPADPLVLRGRDSIRALGDDAASRELVHRVRRAVADEAAGALQVECRYPYGLSVTCLSVFELGSGLITRETRVEVWDA